MSTSPLASTLREAQQRERATAVRLLLCRPLVLARHDPEAFAAVVRHREWLTTWFAELPGWKLVVEPAGGFARLHKVAGALEASRPARLLGRPPFNRRRYALLCLTLAALDDGPSQTTLIRLVDLVKELSQDEPGVETFDSNLFAERRAFVDVLRWLVETGVLGVRDGDAERYAQSREGDALYDVDERLLGQLVAAPLPPSLAGDPERLRQESYPDTDEGERLRLRHAVFRALLDEPVLYYDEMGPREYEWLDHSRGFVYRVLEEQAGLRVERRKEGLAVVDPEGETSDTLFPDGGSTVKHAALLLAQQLTRRRREQGRESVSHPEVVSWTAALFADYGERCHWSRQYPPGDDGATRLALEAMELLEAFDLVRRDAEGWTARPAIARFAPAAPKAGVIGDTGPAGGSTLVGDIL